MNQAEENNLDQKPSQEEIYSFEKKLQELEAGMASLETDVTEGNTRIDALEKASKTLEGDVSGIDIELEKSESDMLEKALE